jgi:preprotein translocase subunit SecD
MYKNLRWKFVTVVVVAGLAIWSFTPPSQKIRLGLDLKGGIHLVLAVKTDDALRIETETAVEQLRAALKDQNIIVAGKADSLIQFSIEGVPGANDQQFRTLADTQVGTSFDRDQVEPGKYTFRMKPNIAVQRRAESVTQAIQTIDRRVNELGVSEPVVAPYGTSGDQIIVQLPGVPDVARAKKLISNTALLQLKIVEGGPGVDQASLLSATNGQIPEDMQVVPGVGATDGAAPAFYLVRKAAAITGTDLRTARSTLDENNLPRVSFTLNNEGVAKFSRATAANVKKSLAIILDDRVVSAPTIE